MNIFNIKISTNVHSVEFNRRYARCKCVFGCPSLHKEWMKYSENIEPASRDNLMDAIVEFAESKKVKIVSENPSVDVVDGKYVISIEYEFSW